MTTNTLTALDELADRIPRSHGPLADDPLAETSRHVLTATNHGIVALDGSPAGKDALALGALLAGSACSVPGQPKRLARGRWPAGGTLTRSTPDRPKGGI